MISFQEQIELFKIIGLELKEKIVCYAIGGSAMMHYGAKVDTKDVDLVFLEEKSLEEVKKTLSAMGFDEKQSMIKIFKRYETAKKTPVMMVRGDERFDLFLKEIITMKMSEGMIERVRETHEFHNCIVKIVSPEDIFLLKSATEREKDKADALSLLEKFKLDWRIIIDESLNQTKLGKHLFPVYLFDFLYELKEDLKAEIPRKVLDDVRKIAEGLLEEKLNVNGKKRSLGKKRRV